MPHRLPARQVQTRSFGTPADPHGGLVERSTRSWSSHVRPDTALWGDIVSQVSLARHLLCAFVFATSPFICCSWAPWGSNPQPAD